jgi:ABC-type amino acid transport system permease subunit
MKKHRIDHGSYAIEIWAGLFISGIYILSAPQVLFSIPNWFENTIAGILCVGSGLCLWGAALGTKWCYPNAAEQTSYRLELIGLPLISIILGVLAVATDVSAIAQFTLSGGLGVPVQIASLRMIAKLWTALHIWGDAPASVKKGQ